jgi:hypothetical protein
MTWKASVMAYFKVLLQRFSGGTSDSLDKIVSEHPGKFETGGYRTRSAQEVYPLPPTNTVFRIAEIFHAETFVRKLKLIAYFISMLSHRIGYRIARVN